MDQVKIGRFIAGCRKKNNLTQAQLAEMLGITDRAVSKWETGKSLPDSSVMLELCGILKITVNDLLSGEVVTMENYNKELENNLLEMIKQKEQADKKLLTMEIVTGLIALIPLIPATYIANTVPMKESTQVAIVLGSIVPLLVATPFMLKIEQTAGYYKCKKCGHTYVPEYKSVFWAPHIGWSRYMKCPECGQKSYHKKVLTKE